MKYIMLNETFVCNKKDKKIVLHRIKRISDGELGGWIESEANLSQEGSCWIEKGSFVYENAKISGDAQILQVSKIHNNAQIDGNTKIYDSDVSGNACIHGNIVIKDSYITDDIKIYGNVDISKCGIGNTIIDYDKNYITPFVVIRNSIIKNCCLYNHIRIKDIAAFNSTIENSIVIGNVHVEKSKLYTVTIQNPHDKFKLIILNKKFKYKNIRSKK